jgi:predicted esterase
MSKLLDAIEIETGKNPAASVIWMHGLGADGNDFVPSSTGCRRSVSCSRMRRCGR